MEKKKLFEERRNEDRCGGGARSRKDYPASCRQSRYFYNSLARVQISALYHPSSHVRFSSSIVRFSACLSAWILSLFHADLLYPSIFFMLLSPPVDFMLSFSPIFPTTSLPLTPFCHLPKPQHTLKLGLQSVSEGQVWCDSKWAGAKRERTV